MTIQTSLPRTRQPGFIRPAGTVRAGVVRAGGGLAGIVTVLLIGLSACEKEPATKTEANIATEPSPVIDKTRVNSAADHLWIAGGNILSSSVAGATALNSAIEHFLSSPSKETLPIAQQKWQEAFLAYRQFYFFYFLAQAAPSHFNSLAELHFRIAAHPIQPGYLDSFGPYLYSGLVHDIGMRINRENLISQHGLTNSEDAALGLYAMHFMLFGIDGDRAPADYSAVKQLSRKDVEAGFKQVKETPNHRRRLLLQMQANILLDDLTALHDSWQSNELNSLHLNWQALAVQDKLNLVRQTLKQGLTQLIVDVVELNKLKKSASTEVNATAKAQPAEANEPEEVATAENSFSYSNYPAASQQQFVLLSIESLLNAVPVLQKEKREPIENLLLETSSMLAEPFDEAQENSWTKVYQNLKAAVDALNAVPPTVESG